MPPIAAGNHDSRRLVTNDTHDDINIKRQVSIEARSCDSQDYPKIRTAYTHSYTLRGIVAAVKE